MVERCCHRRVRTTRQLCARAPQCVAALGLGVVMVVESVVGWAFRIAHVSTADNVCFQSLNGIKHVAHSVLFERRLVCVGQE